MAGYQRWVTYASDDTEAWKCLVLGRSLRKSLTTRETCVILSNQVSEKMRSMLETEFDVCQQLGLTDVNKYPDLQFRSVAKIFAWKLTKKFVFLDCNCLALKNVDELFRKQEMVQFVGAGNQKFTALAVVGVASSNSKLRGNLEQIVVEENDQNRSSGEINKNDFPVENNDYCLEVNLKDDCDMSITAQDIKLMCFTSGHPIDFVTQKMNKPRKLDTFKQAIMEFFGSLCPEINGHGMPQELKNSGHNVNNSVAIVGMAFRLPGANNVDEFWSILEQGHEGICKVPEHRWTNEHAAKSLDEIENTEAGFISCPIDTFDAKFFNTNITDTFLTDPQQRLMLKIVWEGLENAGIDPNTLKNTLTGVFGGWWRHDYKEMLQANGFTEAEFLRTYLGNTLGTMTARISHFFELVGPSIPTESGCSTSIVGVDMACDSLKNENCDLALAVGANLFIHPFNTDLMPSVIAPNGRSKAFDADADGFGRAEGMAVLVLKRYPDAVANGDRIWGLIRGSAVVQEGLSKNMGTPTVECESLAMSLALERADVHPSEVSYVETHGTGTPVGDPLEVEAVTKAYSCKGRKDVLTIGSVKTNIGHTESVSGLAGIIKTLLSMQNEMIPPHINFKALNPMINLGAIPAQLPIKAIPWKKSITPRIAGVSSFGITGTDAHVIIQEPPNVKSSHLQLFDSLPMKIMTFSGKTEESVVQQMKLYKTFLKNTNSTLNDIEYTMHIGRAHLPIRHSLIVKNKQEAIDGLEGNIEMKSTTTTAPKICFLFTGQGSQYCGMAQSLYRSSVVFASNFDHCDAILSKKYGFSIKDAIWGADPQLNAQLKRTLYSQTSIFVVEYCLLKLWESWGITPTTVVGHSLGEFGAAVAAGMLTLADALQLVVTRSKLIDALPTGSMLVVGEDRKTVEALLKRTLTPNGMWLDIAAVNTPEQTVLAGTKEAVKSFAESCNNNKMKTHVLDASHAFHSRLMDPMLREYEAVASQIKYKEPTNNCTFVSGMDGKVVKKVDAKYFVRHTREKVRFVQASEAIFNEGDTTFLEIGPHPVLSAMIMINSDTADLTQPPICCASIRKKADDWTTMLTTLGKLYSMGVSVNWQNFHRFSNTNKVDIPGYCFDEVSHWQPIPTDGTVPFHPLLGAAVPNPTETKLFKNSINVHNISYLMDHVLVDKIIFPGAGYLEMCLTAGYTALMGHSGVELMKPSSPVSINNFFIESPLCLSEKTPTQCQVVVNKSTDSAEIQASVYTKLFLDETNFKWVRHNTSTFSTAVTETAHEDWKQIVERCSVELGSQFDYSFLEEFGFKFGPTFKTITKAWKAKSHKTVDGDEEMLFEFATEGSIDKYFLHPCLMDAMFQAQIIGMSKTLKKQQSSGSKMLIVPLQIQNFTLWNQLSSKSGFIHAKPTEDGMMTAELRDKDGLLIATMVGAEFVETTLSNIMAMIESQRNPYPNVYDLTWRDELGPLEKRIADDRRVKLSLAEIIGTPAENLHFNTFTCEEQEFYDKSNSLFGLYMLKALVQLGIKSHISKGLVHWPSIGNDLQVLPGLHKFLRHILMELSRDGWFNVKKEAQEEMEFEVISTLPDVDTINSKIEKLTVEIKLKEIGIIDLECVQPFGETLDKILTGEVSALPMLFPEGENVRGPAERYYQDSLFSEKSRTVQLHVIPTYLEKLCTLPTKTGEQSIVRLLEVGAGTGTTTREFISQIIKLERCSNFEYTFTDISPAFLPKGEQLFNGTAIAAKFGTLNIEQDPVEQGYIPGHYDVVSANYVLHATHDIKKTLKNVVKLLKPGGFFYITELTRPNRVINLIFGGLEQFWIFEDLSLRPYNCEISAQKWNQVLSELGFESNEIVSFNSANGVILAKLAKSSNQSLNSMTPEIELKPKWIIFGDHGQVYQEVVKNLNIANENHVLITNQQIRQFTPNTGTTENHLEKNITQILDDLTNKLTDTAHIDGLIFLWGLDEKRTYQEICEPYLYICKYLVNWVSNVKLIVFTKGNMSVGQSDFSSTEPHTSPIIAVTNSACNENPLIIPKCVDLDPVLMLTDISEAVGEAMVELYAMDKENKVAYRGHRRNKLRMKPLTIANTALTLPRSSNYKMVLSTSNMISDLRFVPLEQKPMKENQVEVKVKAYSLNFKDLMAVLKPDPVFEGYNTVGLDYTGVVTAVGAACSKVKIGDCVAGIKMDGDALPSSVIVNETYILPLNDKFTYCDGATIPAAFFTVYACLIETAKIKEGDIVLIHTATGGVGLCAIDICLKAKCTIVATAGNDKKRNYLKNLGIQHVFNSRSTNYEQDIQTALGGPRVDVVLNSLTGVGYKEATLAVCAPGARFVEMSKMNIWSKEEVKALRPDVIYETVDVSQMSEEKMVEYCEKMCQSLTSSNNGNLSIRPLPYIRFDSTEIRQALEFMQKAKHIGKIIVSMPDSSSSMQIDLFNENSTYLITGGLGGIGLEVADWMGRKGAKNILLVGRSPPKKHVLQRIDAIKSKGINVVVQLLDIGDFTQCKNLVDSITQELQLPALRGIMHAAGQLADETFENQNWEKFETVFNAKIRGSWNLHKLTLSLELPLEHFVLFSSASALFSPIGQPNHSAGNNYLDCFAHYRNSQGLPATTINWGQWGQVGVAANTQINWLKPFTLHQGIAVLEHALSSNQNHIIAIDADLSHLCKFCPSAISFVSEIGNHDQSGSCSELDGNSFWPEYDAAETYEDKYNVMKKFIKIIIRFNLKLAKNQEIEDHADLQDLGMDSLMIVEMKNGLQMTLGKRLKLPINAVRDRKNVHELAERIVDMISGKDVTPPNAEELIQLIKEDSLLPENIKIDETIIKPVKISNCSTALITSFTGVLDPYILREILKNPAIQTVYFISKENVATPEKQLTKVLEERNILDEIDISKVKHVVGDVALEQFGLNEEVYQKLCQDVELVFNLPANTGHTDSYGKTNDTRNMHLHGVTNVLTFATKCRLKYIYHASTMIATTQLDEEGRFSEEWPIEGEMDNLPNSANYLSKFVSERLLAQAVERGVPCKVFRFPVLGGDSKESVSMEEESMQRFLVYMAIGYMPALNIPIAVLPVDQSAKISCSLFFSDKTGCEVFNVSNPYLGDERAFDEIAEEFGVFVDVVEPEDFYAKLPTFKEHAHLFHGAKLEGFIDYLPAPFLKWLEGDKNVFFSKKLSALLPLDYPGSIKPTWEAIKKDLENAKNAGVFDKFGIKQTLG